MEIFQGGVTLAEQAVRLAQLIFLPVMGIMCLTGLLLLLTAGKSPRRKRAGYVFSLGGTIGAFMVAYIPLLAFEFFGTEPTAATGDETIYSIVDSYGGFGQGAFTAIQYVAIPLVGTIFYIGVFVQLLAAKSPQRKRVGLGLMIFAPIVLGAVYIIPQLLELL
ncbi:hypothetical protein J2S74_002974 [Evansella vedderi]|uniref:Uncharacterized protein n=1 Tax=Evansella vedderi TaxID=38282 RepID=A0ABT9ZWH9_9BACI|nr:hypothetical protein [Evansella vedderi]MDQ0255592.1 hypothetical protein [Evansella vedderi]